MQLQIFQKKLIGRIIRSAIKQRAREIAKQ